MLGIRPSNLPAVGTPLRHADLRVLEVLPGITWKAEDVGQALLTLAARCGGAPRAILGDGEAVKIRVAEVVRLRISCRKPNSDESGYLGTGPQLLPDFAARGEG